LLGPAEHSDAEALAGIFIRCWRDAYRGVVADEIVDGLEHGTVRQWWRELLASPRSRTVVARVREAPVGMIRFGTDEEDPARGHVFSLYVDPAAAGAGVGRALLEHALAELAGDGRYRTATLWVFAGNDRALRFYRAAGWVATGRTRVEPAWQAEELQLAVDLAERGQAQEELARGGDT
jgi:ribosomal protein S18 acetylase RimI-like enzyme